jgi:5-methyltetrahydrofolate--homocysteine methyltransferase
VVKVLTKNGANAVGLNCGDIDPFEMAELVPIFRENTNLPIAVQPNAGKPRLVDGRSIFDLDPKRFSEGLAKCIENGANIVGGCCGTTPAHIKEASGLDYSQDPSVVGERGMGSVLF